VNESDHVLLERLHHGDRAAFEEVFIRHYQQVYRAVYNLVGSHEEAEDLVQETFLVLYDNPPPPSTGDGLTAWLCRVGLNRGYNALRSMRRAQQRIERIAPQTGATDPYHDVVRSEERAYVQAVLARLPERQSKLLLLRYAGFSYAEIAAIVQVAPGSVGTLLARAERAFVAKCEDAVVAYV
jgi:RNA polymerase sigma-70 factor (ECF subfamily)